MSLDQTSCHWIISIGDNPKKKTNKTKKKKTWNPGFRNLESGNRNPQSTASLLKYIEDITRWLEDMNFMFEL